MSKPRHPCPWTQHFIRDVCGHLYPLAHVPLDAPTVHPYISPICPSSSSPSYCSLPISVSTLSHRQLLLYSSILLFIYSLSSHFIYYYHTTLLPYFQYLHTFYSSPHPSSDPHSFLFRSPARWVLCSHCLFLELITFRSPASLIKSGHSHTNSRKESSPKDWCSSPPDTS